MDAGFSLELREGQVLSRVIFFLPLSQSKLQSNFFQDCH